MQHRRPVWTAVVARRGLLRISATRLSYTEQTVSLRSVDIETIRRAIADRLIKFLDQLIQAPQLLDEIASLAVRNAQFDRSEPHGDDVALPGEVVRAVSVLHHLRELAECDERHEPVASADLLQDVVENRDAPVNDSMTDQLTVGIWWLWKRDDFSFSFLSTSLHCNLWVKVQSDRANPTTISPVCQPIHS